MNNSLKTLVLAVCLVFFPHSALAMTIYVGNLAWTFTDDDLEGLFNQYGTVSSAKLVKDPNNGNRSKGYGFVVMPDDHRAKDAIAALDGAELMGRKIVVYESNPSEPANGGFKKPASPPNLPARFPAVPQATPEKVPDNAAAEEPVVEEPVVEELIEEKLFFEEPVDEEPVAEAPVAEEAADEEPVDEEPFDEEPFDEEPVDEAE